MHITPQLSLEGEKLAAITSAVARSVDVAGETAVLNHQHPRLTILNQLELES